MRIAKTVWIALLAGLLPFGGPPGLGAEIRFSDLDLGKGDRLLFRAQADIPGQGTYDTLFEADLPGRRAAQLTVYPERATLLQDRTVLQIQNRFGVFRTAAGWQGLQAIRQFPSFADGTPVSDGRIVPIHTSPDGRFLLFLRARSAAYGSLLLYDLEGEREVPVAEAVEYSLDGPAAAWSPDAAFFIYARAGQLYYYSIGQLREGRVLAEEMRRIGPGRIGNVQWGRSDTLFYLTGDLVYELDSRELFTRALYAGFLKIGSVRGKLPFPFDPSFDRFWVSPDGSKVLLDKGGRNLFLYILTREDFLSTGDSLSLPYLYLPRNTRVRQVVWEVDTITLLADSLTSGRHGTAVYRLGVSPPAAPADPAAAAALAAPPVFRRMEETGVSDMVLSPDGERIALLMDDRVSLRDATLWKEVATFPHPRPLHLLWVSEDELILAGAWWTELRNLRTGEVRLISLSQPGEFGWERGGDRVLAKVQDRVYARGVLAEGEHARSSAGEAADWTPIARLEVRARSLASDAYRVYLESLANGSYRNMVMVRSLRTPGTTALLAREQTAYEPFPAADEPADPAGFSHGSRIRQREAALTFDVVENIEGLPTVLDTLARYGLRCTFFVNGEAVRRYPDAVREIAESGHEVGSLFYAWFDMTDARFQVDDEFIRRGLARNEDDFHAATGRELSLLWHAPYYFVNSGILAASRQMNYTYVGRDVDPLDWVARHSPLAASGLYQRSADLVERVIRQKKPGSIIPVQVGMPEGGRDDYLFHDLDLLIDTLLRLGYRIVPVSTLIEHAR